MYWTIHFKLDLKCYHKHSKMSVCWIKFTNNFKNVVAVIILQHFRKISRNHHLYY